VLPLNVHSFCCNVRKNWASKCAGELSRL
jgi:hypothetical protein